MKTKPIGEKKLTLKKLTEVHNSIPVDCKHDGINFDSRCKECQSTSKPNEWEERASIYFKDKPIVWDNHAGGWFLKKEDVFDFIRIELSQAILSAEENLLREIMEEMPKEKDIIYANGDLRQLANYHEEIGFNTCHDQVNTLLERKLSTVKK